MKKINVEETIKLFKDWVVGNGGRHFTISESLNDGVVILYGHIGKNCYMILMTKDLITTTGDFKEKNLHTTEEFANFLQNATI